MFLSKQVPGWTKYLTTFHFKNSRSKVTASLGYQGFASKLTIASGTITKFIWVTVINESLILTQSNVFFYSLNKVSNNALSLNLHFEFEFRHFEHWCERTKTHCLSWWSDCNSPLITVLEIVILEHQKDWIIPQSDFETSLSGI